MDRFKIRKFCYREYHQKTEKTTHIILEKIFLNHVSDTGQPQCLSTDAWIDKMYYIYILKYYFSIKTNEVRIHGITWVNVENKLMKETSHKRPHIYMIPFI